MVQVNTTLKRTMYEFKNFQSLYLVIKVDQDIFFQRHILPILFPRQNPRCARYLCSRSLSRWDNLILLILECFIVHILDLLRGWMKSSMMCKISYVFFLGVLILTAIANQYRLHKLSKVDQFVMMYGGLRGAVAFALVLLVDGKVCYFFIIPPMDSYEFY